MRIVPKLRQFFSNVKSHPLATPFGLFGTFVSFVALLDYNRDTDLSEEDKLDFKQDRLFKENNLSDELQIIHDRAFTGRITYAEVSNYSKSVGKKK